MVRVRVRVRVSVSVRVSVRVRVRVSPLLLGVSDDDMRLLRLGDLAQLGIEVQDLQRARGRGVKPADLQAQDKG